MPQLDVRVLGPVDVLWAGRRAPLSPKERDLVALLVARWPEPVATDRIEEELWNGDPPATARKVVQKYVSQLRASLGAEHIEWSRDGYALRDVSVDAVSFARAVDGAAGYEARRAAAALADALRLWRGEPYAGVELAALEAERVRLTELKLLARQQEIEAELTLGRHAALLGRLEALVAEHPLGESLWHQLIRAYYGAGRQSDALRAYRRLRKRLGEELGVEPSPELRALERRVLLHDPTLSPTAPRGHAAEHRRELTVVAVAIAADAGDPEDRADAAKQDLGAVQRICDAHGGRVETAIGSRIVACFGDPAHGDDADRAVRAANQIVAELGPARIGVATGWALVAPGARPGTRVVGAVIDTALGCVDAAAPGDVVVDPSTARAGAATGPEPPFVGRADHVATLEELVRRMIAGDGPRVVSLVGDAGVGKTRLVAELRRRAPAGTRWLTADCRPGGGPSGPLRDIAGASVLDEVVADAEERQWLRVAIGRGAGADQGELTAAATTLLAALGRAGPAVVVFEDAHRADPGFAALLSSCIHQLGRAPLLVLVTARQPTAGRQVTVGGLAPGELEALLDRLLPEDRLNGVQRRALAARSAGNPLYAIQFARMVEQDRWDGSVPATVRSLIAARLDLLAPHDAEVLVAAAVLAPTFAPAFDPAELTETMDVDDASTAEALERLRATGLVERAGAGRYRLSHDLVQEIAYERLPRPARAQLHRAAADVVERRAGEHLPAHAMRMAHHLNAAAQAVEEQGRDSYALRRRAVDLMMLAGDSLGDRAGGTGAALPAGADQIETTRVRAESMCRRGELRLAAETADGGLAAALAAGDRAAQARLYALIGSISWLRGDTTVCVEALEAALGLVEDLEPGRPMLDAISNLAFVTALLGRTGEAIELAEQGLQLAREANDPDAAEKEVRCLKARGAARLLEGDLGGYVDFTTVLARALERGLGHESAMAYHNLAELHWQGEGPVAGLELNGKGLELAERRGLVVAADWLRANRVALCFDGGRWDEALELAETTLSQETASGEGQAGTMGAVWAARIHVWRGEHEKAERLVDFFLPRARRHAVIQQLGPALVVAGLVETAGGHPGRGAQRAAEFCALTENTREYRHMELADTVRLLLADGRVDDAERAADSRVIATVRSECHSATAAAAIAMARGRSDAGCLFERAAAAWRAFGHPLEAYLAGRAVGTTGRDELGVDARVVGAFTPAAPR